MDPAERQGLWDRWYAWAQGEFPADELVVYCAALAAMRELESGRGSAAAAAAARTTAQTVNTALAQAGAGEEIGHIEYVLRDLAAIDPAQLSARARRTLTDRYQRRRAELTALEVAQSQPIAGAPVATVVGAADGGTAAVGDAPVPGPSPGVPGPATVRTGPGWSDELGILVLSYIGAFLLVVATLLFEVYGLRGTSGVVQFLAVLVLNLLFGALGWAALRSARLRVVGRTYIAIFALMAPLVVVAAYQFLVLSEHGIGPQLALFLGATYCTVLYGVLAARLGSVAYAWLAAVALAVAAYGLAATAGQERWAPVLLAIVCGIYLVQSFFRGSPHGALFAGPARVLPAVVGPVAILLAVGYASMEFEDPGLRAPYLPITFMVLAAAYAGHSARWRLGWLSWAVPKAISLAALTANVSLRGDANSAVLTLLVLAYGYALAARPAGRWGLSDFLRVAAAIQALAAVAAHYDQPALQAMVLAAAAGVGLFLALESRQPWWLLVFTAMFSLAWYWLVRVVVPPPANPGPDTLALVLSPLPVIFSGAALGLRAWLQPQRRLHWALPLYVSAASLTAIVIGIGASNAANLAVTGNQATAALNLVGWLLIGYGVLTYAVGLLEQQPVAVPIAGAGVALGATTILLGSDYPAGVFPLVLTAIAVGFYAAQALWSGGGAGNTLWASMHRWTGAGILAATALYGFAVPAYSQAQNPAVLSTVVAIAALAGLLYVDSRIFRRAHGDLLAIVAASFIVGRLATFVGLDNPQFHVLGPGLALAAVGRMLVLRDRAQRTLAQLSTGAGATALLLVTLLQTGGYSATASLYIALLLVESIIGIAVGISWRSRVLVIAGGVGAAVAALRALFQVAQFIPLFAVFGIAAVLVLVVAAVLAVARDRLVHAGAAANALWKEWD